VTITENFERLGHKGGESLIEFLKFYIILSRSGKSSTILSKSQNTNLQKIVINNIFFISHHRIQSKRNWFSFPPKQTLATVAKGFLEINGIVSFLINYCNDNKLKIFVFHLKTYFSFYSIKALSIGNQNEINTCPINNKP
jgi:hypothetical protein